MWDLSFFFNPDMIVHVGVKEESSTCVPKSAAEHALCMTPENVIRLLVSVKSGTCGET
jgi:hypothetical protein